MPVPPPDAAVVSADAVVSLLPAVVAAAVVAAAVVSDEAAVVSDELPPSSPPHAAATRVSAIAPASSAKPLRVLTVPPSGFEGTASTVGRVGERRVNERCPSVQRRL